MSCKNIPIEKITVTDNVREVKDNDINNLAESIEKHDLLQPVLVRPLNDGRYELISGHRRLKALKLLNEPFVPCYIRSV